MNVSSVFADNIITYNVGTYATNNNITVKDGGTSTSNTGSIATNTKMFSTDGKYTVTLGDGFYFYNSAVSGYTTALVSANGKKSYFTIDLNAGDKIEIYFAASNSSYSQAKQKTMKFYSENDEGKTLQNTSGFTATKLEYTALKSETYTMYDSAQDTNRFVLYKIDITPVTKPSSTTDVTLNVKDTVTGNAITDFTVSDSDGAVSANSDGTYPLYLNSQYSISAPNYVTSENVLVTSATTEVALTPIYNVTIAGAPDGYTVEDEAGNAVDQNEDGTYTMTYGKNYVIKCDGYSDYQFTCSGETLTVEMLSTVDVTFTVKNSDGEVVTDFDVLDSDGSKLTAVNSAYTLYPGSVYTIVADGYINYQYTATADKSAKLTLTTLTEWKLTGDDGTNAGLTDSASTADVNAGTNNFFTIAKGAKMQSSERTYKAADGTSITSKPTINTSKAITFTTTQAARIYVAATSGGGSERTMSLAKGGTTITTTTLDEAYTPNYIDYIAVDAGTYTISGSNQVRYYLIEVIPIDATPVEVTLNTTGLADGAKVTLTRTSGSLSYSGTVADNKATVEKVIVGEYKVAVDGYTVTPDTITVTADNTLFNIDAEQIILPEIPDDASTSELYVGYAAKDGYTVYDTVQAAVTAATNGGTINIAEGTFTERVVVENANITLKGAGVDKTIITYNDSEANNDTYFHGATVAVVADGFNASDLTIRNTAEEDGTAIKDGKYKNATAFSVGYKNNLAATATLTNCNLLAFRDTVYTGKPNTDITLTLDGCLITGFQDVICGTGKVNIDGCTMDTSRTATGTKDADTARLFAPRGYEDTTKDTVYTVTNLTITSSATTKKIYLARPWETYTQETSTSPKVWDEKNNVKVIVDGYTVDDSAKSVFDTTLYGFSPDGINISGVTSNYFWLVRPTNGKGNFNTTLAALNETATDVVDSVTAEEGEENTYRIIGKVNSALVEDTNVSAIGFAVSDTNGFIGNMSSDTIYVDPALDNPTEYFTVNFATDVDTTVTTTLTPYVNYKGYDVVSSSATAKAIDYPA
jgi:hypothetical protein